MQTRNWELIIKKQVESGLNRAEYCRRMKIPYDQFKYYIKQQGKFLPVVRAENFVELVLKSGAKLKVTNSSSVNLITKVLEADAKTKA